MKAPFSLLIISEDSIKEIVSKGLKELNIEIKTDYSKSGNEALKLIESRVYDLVISGYRTQDLSGTDLINAIKKKGGNIPLIIVTDPGDEDNAANDLFNGLDFKPVRSTDPEGLLKCTKDKITAAIDQKRACENILSPDEYLRQILNLVENFGIIATDENKVITFFSEGAEKLLGYRSDEVVGKETPAIFHLEDELSQRAGQLSERIGRHIDGIELFAEKMADDGLERHEWTYKRKDGGLLNVDLTVTPIIDKQGNVRGAFGIFYDITEKKRLEKEFEFYKIQSSGIITHLPEATFAIDREGRVIAWNEAIEETTGIPASEILGKGDYEYSIPFYGERRPILIDLITASENEINKLKYKGMTKRGNVISVDAEPLEVEGSIRYIRANASPIYDDAGDIIGAIESLSDVTSQKEIELALRESEAKFRGIAERSSDMIMFVDTNAIIIYISPASLRILGYKPEEMEGRGPDEFIAPEDLQRGLDNIKKTLRGEGIESFEFHLIKKDGGIAIVDLSATPIIEDGIVKGVQVISRDVTDKKRSQERILGLLEEQKELMDIIKRSPAVVFLWKAEDNWPVERVSENISQFGYTVEDFTSGRVIFSSIIHPDDLERIASEVEYNSENKIDEYLQIYRILDKDKKEHWIEDFTHIRRNENGEITHYQGIIIDITDRKKAEDELKESSAILRGIVESPKGVVIFALDGDYRYLAFNENHRQTMKKIWGIDIAIGKSMPDYITSPEDHEKAKTNFNRALSGESFTVIEEYGDTALERLWYENIYNPITDEKGDVIGLTVFLTDITERKRMEEIVKESEVRYHQLFESSPISLWEEDFSEGKIYLDKLKKSGISDFRGYFDEHPEEVVRLASMVRILDVNETTLDLMEAKSKEELRIGLPKVFTEESLRVFKEELITLADGGLEYKIDGTHKTLKGRELSVITQMVVAPGYEDTLGRILISIQDITDRKKAEEALATEKEKTESIIDSLPGVFYIFSEEGKIIRWNKNFETLTGYSAEQIRDIPALNFIDERYREQVGSAIKKAFEDGYAEVEGALITKDGNIPMFLSAYAKEIDNIPYLLGTGVDITAAKEARQEIQRLAAIVQHSGELISMADEDGNFIFINEAGSKMIGIEVDEISKHKVLEIFTNEQREKVKSEIVPAMNDKGFWEGELQYVNIKTGQPFDVHAMTFIIDDSETGKPLFYANVSLDITEKKRDKKALAREKANVEYIIESLPGMFYMFYMFDSTGKFVRWNKNTETITGYSADEIRDMRPLEFIEEEYRGQIAEAIQTAFSEGYADLEAVIVTKKGEKIPFFFSANKKTIDGTPYILGMGLDITKAKETEKEISKLASIVRYSGEMIALTNPEGIINFMNDAGTRMVGVKASEISKYHFMDFIPDNLKEKMNSEVLPTMAKDELWEGDLQYLNKKTGDIIDVHAMTFNINDPETGALAYLANVSMNISDRKKAEAALKEVNKKLNLLGSITRHDILNQVTVALGYMDILEMDGATACNIRAAEYYRKVLEAIKTIERQILFTKDYKDLGELSPEWYNVGSLIDINYNNSSAFQTVSLINETGDLEIYADPLFEKVIYNLFDNAVKHGEKITTIKFSFERTGDDINLICKDDGNGIPVEFKDKIFKREYYKHTGLGLFLSREILSITGLSVEENGQYGEGARFVIHVPKGLFRFEE